VSFLPFAVRDPRTAKHCSPVVKRTSCNNSDYLLPCIHTVDHLHVAMDCWAKVCGRSHQMRRSVVQMAMMTGTAFLVINQNCFKPCFQVPPPRPELF
jgi:hypothetical protein